MLKIGFMTLFSGFSLNLLKLYTTKTLQHYVYVVSRGCYISQQMSFLILKCSVTFSAHIVFPISFCINYSLPTATE